MKHGATHSVTKGFMKEVEDHSCVWPSCMLHKPLCMHLCYSSKRLRHEVVEHLCRKVVANAHVGRRIEHTVHRTHFSILCATVGVLYLTCIQIMEAIQNLNGLLFCIHCGRKRARLSYRLLKKNGGHIKQIVY